jgi:phosphinothricin acetyltransferase
MGLVQRVCGWAGGVGHGLCVCFNTANFPGWHLLLTFFHGEWRSFDMRPDFGEAMIIRPAQKNDLAALVDILNHYIEHSNVTFETTPVTVEERSDWIDGFGTGPYQMLVAERNGTVIGCAYSSRYRPRSAFNSTVETSIYLSPTHRGCGAGTALYSKLFDILALQPVHLAVAGIAIPNDASIALHRKFGFAEVGTFKEYASKNGEWMSSTWFQRFIR